jgi:hypothetical protein
MVFLLHFRFVDILKFQYTDLGASCNSLTLLGLRPAALAAPVRIETVLHISESPVEPCPMSTLTGVGIEGVKPTPVCVIPLLFLYAEFQ